MDIYPVDYTSDVGRVRKYIPDVVQLPDPQDALSEPSYMWSDLAIQSFLDDEGAVGLAGATLPTVLRAAASILVATANNENLILKKLATDDLQTDGPAVAKAMLASAQELRKRADDIDATTAEEETFTVVTYPSYDSYNPFGMSGWY